MRVCFVGLWWVAGDPTRVELARALQTRGHDVVLVEARAERAGVLPDDLRWVRPPSPRWLRGAERAAIFLGDRAPVLHLPHLHVARAVRAVAPEMIHSFDLAASPSLWALGQLGLPLVVHDHGGAPTRHALWRPVERAAMARPDAVLMSTPARAAGWVDPAKVRRCPETSTLMVPMSQAEARRITGMHGDPLCLCVGRLDPVKDPMTVLRGFSRLVTRRPGARLAFAWSSGTLETLVRAEVRRDPRLRDRVTLLGPQPPERMVALYSAADVLLQGSLREVMGRAVVEAMACGCAPVVTDIPAFREIVPGPRFGVGDAEGLAACVEASRPDRAALRAHFEATLSFPAIAARVEAIYNEVQATRAAVGKPGRPARSHATSSA